MRNDELLHIAFTILDNPAQVMLEAIDTVSAQPKKKIIEKITKEVESRQRELKEVDRINRRLMKLVV